MKSFKSYFLFAFLSFGFFMVGCEKDDDHDHEDNEITILIDEPTGDVAMADCAEVHIHVDITATDENHNVELVLHPEGDVNDKILDIDKHDHDKEITIEQEIDLCSYPAGTCFHLEVEACVDHDCEEKTTADFEFCLQ